VNTIPHALGLGGLVPILALAAAATQAVPTIFDAVVGEAVYFAGSLEEARAALKP
jgi:hypothetical protein